MEQGNRDQLRQMLLNRSMRFGEFVLSSGATSNYYIDVRKTSLHPEGLLLISQLFYELIEHEEATAIGGLTLGADPLVAGLMTYAAEKAVRSKDSWCAAPARTMDCADRWKATWPGTSA
jgi:orotate phosphoribosyltransferase